MQIVAKVGGQFIFVVIEIVVLKNRGIGKNFSAIIGVVVNQRGNVAVLEYFGRKIIFEITGTGRHIPEAKIIVKPPLTDGSSKIIEGLISKGKRRVKFTGTPPQIFFSHAIHLLANGDYVSDGLNLLVKIPELVIFFRLDSFFDKFAAGHAEKYAVAQILGLALLNVGDEIFGGLATVGNSFAEKFFPVVEDLLKIFGGNFFDGASFIGKGVVYECGKRNFG